MPKADWKQAACEIRDYLQKGVDSKQAAFRDLRPVNEEYFCPDEFVIKNGLPFKPVPRPEGSKRREIKQCYQNAFDAARAHPFHLVYVEGYAFFQGTSAPMKHAWCANRKGEAIDVTWADSMGLAYWGVPITLAYITREVVVRGYSGLLASDLFEWPILSASPDVWRVPTAFFTSPSITAGRKVAWKGRVTSVQPRIRLNRSFDERAHNYLGYVLRLEGTVGDEQREFTVAIGKAAHAKHAFRVGDEVSGKSVPVDFPRMETAELYKASQLKIAERGPEKGSSSPPFLGVPLALPVYRSRGHRRLAAKTYEAKCTACIWGCKMPVVMTIDHWNPSQKRYRFEAFCYGPKSCSFYKAGPKRKVPGRKGMVHVEEDWVDEDATSGRGADE